jgi:2-alkyl-3-oxoalkanoate reductase
MLTYLLGASGFVGSAVIRAARPAGLPLVALARSDAQARLLEQHGVRAIRGERISPEHLRGVGRVIDLIQPSLPERLTEAALARAADYRVQTTREVIAAIQVQPAASRPLLLAISGTDDLARDDAGKVSHRSALVTAPKGFARIGLRARAEVVASGVPFACIYLGTVYGPGKAFAAKVFPGLTAGKLPIVGNGSNRLALIHVDDAARALVRLVGMRTSQLVAHPWIVTDGTSTTQRELLEQAARLLGARPPRSVPRWIASLVAGSVAASSFARDVPTDISALLTSGFGFTHPSIATGLPATIAALAVREAA